MTVAQLQTTIVETNLINGKWHEIWLRESGTTNIIPKTYKSLGSAFFVVSPKQVCHLVTASHVIRDSNPETVIIIASSNGSPLQCTLKEISFISRGIGWQHHQDADVSALPLDQQSQFFNDHLAGRFLPIDVFSKDLSAPQRDTPIRIMGFPLGLGIGPRISPMSRMSGVSSDIMTLPRFDNNQLTEFFLLEDPSIGGYSGSPAYDTGEPFGHDGVLVMRNKGYFACIGLVHGTISDNTGGKLAAITPASKVVELINEVDSNIQQK